MNRRFRRPLEEAELITLTFWPTYHTRGGLIRLQSSALGERFCNLELPGDVFTPTVVHLIRS